MKPSDAKKEILESIDAIQKVKGKVLNSSKDYKHQIYLEPLVKSFSKDKLETKLNRAKYNVIPISDLTKRIKETRENKNKKEKNKKKYIDISVWVNAGSGVCADDEAKAEDVETEIGVFDDDKVKAEEADEVDTEIGDCAADDEATGFEEVKEAYIKMIEIYDIYKKKESMKPSDAKKEILESIDAIQKVKGEVLNSSKDYKHQIYLEPLIKTFSKDKLETKLNRAKYNVIPISDLTKRIKETRENKNKKEKNKKKYIDISVWVNAGSGVCADDEAKAEDVETKIGVFDDDKVKAEEVENSAGVNAESGVCADDEAKADEVDIEIGDCAADDEATVKGEVLNSSKDYKHQIYLEPLVKSFSKDKLETKLNRAKYNVIPISDLTKRIKETRKNKNKKEKNKKKYINISVWVNAGSSVCADDEAKAEDVETKIGVFDDDKVKAEEVENSAGVNVESGVCADDEAKADEIDIEIGDCAADDEATGFDEVKEAYIKMVEIYDIYKKKESMKPSNAKKEILESIDAIQKVKGEVLNSSKDYKHQIYLEPLVKSFSKDKLETKLNHTKYNVIPISDLTKRIKETRENKNKKEKNKKKYIDISVWVNVGSGVCTNDEAKAEDVETEIGVNTKSGVCADDEAKADEVDIEIGDCAADDEATAKEIDTKIGVFDYNGTSKHQSQWDFEKLRGVIQSTPKGFEDVKEAYTKAEDVETEIGVFDDDKAKAEKVENSAGYSLNMVGLQVYRGAFDLEDALLWLEHSGPRKRKC
ncbi:hypothetical protein Q3G72_015229 [Acer saccharum]|nr:hypothetical protein Q3G72_015229 [Acer saccharum]